MSERQQAITRRTPARGFSGLHCNGCCREILANCMTGWSWPGQVRQLRPCYVGRGKFSRWNGRLPPTECAREMEMKCGSPRWTRRHRSAKVEMLNNHQG